MTVKLEVLFSFRLGRPLPLLALQMGLDSSCWYAEPALV